MSKMLQYVHTFDIHVLEMTMTKLILGVSLHQFFFVLFTDQGKKVILMTYTNEIVLACDFDTNFARNVVCFNFGKGSE